VLPPASYVLPVSSTPPQIRAADELCTGDLRGIELGLGVKLHVDEP
jgi:hypothetical protein